jgi:hypothetical protein
MKLNRYYLCVEKNTVHEFEDDQLCGKTPEEAIAEWARLKANGTFQYTYALVTGEDKDGWTPRIPGTREVEL